MAGFAAHVVHRGNNGEVVFHRESDYRFYWRCLKEAADEHRVDVNAYVFMNNHVHLLLTPDSRTGISQAMHNASRRYAVYFNTRYQRTGSLWQRRFHGNPVRDDAYLLKCFRYIDLNPVRAMLVRKPEVFSWSSHRHYAFGEWNPMVTAPTALLSMLRGKPLAEFYRGLFKRGQDEHELAEIREAARTGRVIGIPAPRRGRPRKNGT